jgi:hypothetical protein
MPECALSFNMDWWILVFYPEPEDLSNIMPPWKSKTFKNKHKKQSGGNCAKITMQEINPTSAYEITRDQATPKN